MPLWFLSTLCPSSPQGTSPGCWPVSPLAPRLGLCLCLLPRGADRFASARSVTNSGETASRVPRLPRDPFSLSLPPGDLRPSLWPAPQPDEIQDLTGYLRRITNELNGILGVLSSPNSHPPSHFTSTPCIGGVPLSTFLAGLQAPTRVPVPEQRSRSSGLSSSAAAQPVDSILAEKWRRYFPGRSPACLPTTCDLTAPQGRTAAPSRCWGGQIHWCGWWEGAHAMRGEELAPGPAACG